MLENSEKRNESDKKLEFGFAIGEITDMIAYQGFSFLIFTFYYNVMKLPASLITWGFVFWSIFNSLNDPLLGFLSDKTKTNKLGGGRRRPWIVAAIVPLALIMILLFTPVGSDDITLFIYFFVIINLFDLIYTMYSLNRTSLFPEMFRDNFQRSRVGSLRRIIMILGLIIAFVLPTVLIPDIANVNGNPTIRIYYVVTGAVFAVLILMTGLYFLKNGVREPSNVSNDAPEPFSLKESFKVTIKNKPFMIFIIASTMNWYVFGLLPMIISNYAVFVLNVQEKSILISLLLLAVFLCSAPGVLIWKKVTDRFGARRAMMISTIFWICTFVPIFFISNYWIALPFWCICGIGLGGATYLIDLNISNICDEDELCTGRRREGSFFGMHALVIRLATILVVISIGSVLTTNGWDVFKPDVVTPELIIGLRSLVSLYPIAALLISLIFLKLYPLSDEKASENQKKLANKK
jgi:GPH family glycoside/pentoside/hexuronide:cation symporter